MWNCVSSSLELEAQFTVGLLKHTSLSLRVRARLWGDLAVLSGYHVSASAELWFSTAVVHSICFYIDATVVSEMGCTLQAMRRSIILGRRMQCSVSPLQHLREEDVALKKDWWHT
ncbi:hypothetical protein AOLI_G00090620 [Acnodon oligacanthus]